ncbi:spermatogenesis-associated protein 46 [Calypte anna]|uniref:spermatogenesis-associated protein 46 n=1 Tax=Calypte anna TaxID=9244 RepID=UPI0011C391A6|nr:spermatogenesis-associated protein 46 [Calypte anna]
MGTMAQEPRGGCTRVMDSSALPTDSPGDMSSGSRTQNLEVLCPWGPASLPGTLGSLQTLSSAAPPSSVLPVHTCTVYRPWFSPYSFFMCTPGVTQHYRGSLTSRLTSSTQDPEEPDDLSEIICSSSDSSGKSQHPEKERQDKSRASITVRELLGASRQQRGCRQGYQCLSCCRIFPTLWSLKTHIEHSSQEGYSCKVYYRRLKALREKEQQEREAAARKVPV